MNTTLWVLAGLLGVAYLAAGISLISMERVRYRALGANRHWVDDFDDGQLKTIGVIKTVGAVGLVLPAATGIAPILTPLAATGMMLFMAGAGTTRFRRREWSFMVGDVVFIGLLGFLAWGRFHASPF